MSENIIDYSDKQFDHALKFILENGFLTVDDNNCPLNNVSLDDQFIEYLEDLFEYGLTRYTVDYGEETGFKLWQSYRMDQVQLKLLNNPGHNQLGTYYNDKSVVIFASLKKDANIEEKLNYKDKFISPTLFQWESRHDLPISELNKLKESEEVLLFIRKVEKENGIVMPHIYVGKGKLNNPRGPEKHGTYLFDILMENELPDYLQYDFGLTK